MKTLKRKAYAKINLSLDVTGKRENGYHDVDMIMQTVDLYDELEFSTRETVLSLDGGYSISIDVELADGQTEQLPSDDSNLIYKAARLVFEKAGINRDLSVKLKKNIPIAAGMAGGSTDAACTIRAIDELFNIGLNPEQAEEIAVKIGADVPYCLYGGTKRARGIGEQLDSLPAAPDLMLLIVKPGISVSTPAVYKAFDSLQEVEHPSVEKMIEAINEGDKNKLTSLLGNVLEGVTIPQNPIIGDIKNKLIELGAVNALMSGSGPTVFGIFESEELLKSAYNEMIIFDGVTQVFISHLCEECA